MVSLYKRAHHLITRPLRRVIWALKCQRPQPTDCPGCNNLILEIERLERRYYQSAQGG